MSGPRKVAVVLHAGTGTDDGMSRALHALLYAKELQAAGCDVRLIFDGAGTAWVAEFEQTGHEMQTLYNEVKERVGIHAICEYCADAYGVRDRLGTGARFLRGEFGGHPSLADLVAGGYQIITL